MKLDTPEISWHGREPIYSVDFQPCNSGASKKEPRRLATAGCGTDGNLRIWYIKINNDGKAMAEFASNLSRHTKSVNVVRFSPDGQILASGGDDCLVILWKLTDTQGGSSAFGKEDEECKEGWTAFKMLRGHLEDVYDLSWSPSGSRLLSGSVDNSAIIWDVAKGEKLVIFKDHRSFVQGVAWDPLGKYCATLSCDRSFRLYNLNNNRCAFNITKMSLATTTNSGEGITKQCRMFHDDSMRSFFRRLTFSPDGQLLIVPSGCLEMGEVSPSCNTTYMFTRSSIPRPAAHLPGPPKATLAVRCCPVFFELRKADEETQEATENSTKEERMDTSEVTGPNKDPVEAEKADATKETASSAESVQNSKEPQSLFSLPYRIAFAVATEDSILLYDTQQTIPFGLISNIHYHQLSDVSWSSDGQILVVSSTDGYCSLVTFEEGEIGVPYKTAPVVPVATVGSNVTAASETACGKPPTSVIPASQASFGQAKPVTSETLAGMNVHKVTANQGGSASAVAKVEPRRIALTTLGTSTAPKTTGSQPRRISTTQLSSPPSSQSNPCPTVSTNQNPTATGYSTPNSQMQTVHKSPQGVQPRRIQLTTLSISKPPVSEVSPTNKSVAMVTTPVSTINQMPLTTDIQGTQSLRKGMAEPVLDNKKIEAINVPEGDSPMEGVTEIAPKSQDKDVMLTT
ncbi:chromatin assembly factor 1 subunit B-like [Acanthaster planci]|uniref:Chromatin assembly factor 1 subunit B-like n=1 Tax=Acanthaster planci TaxID=133434 RepID=A0A8B7ZPV0_ACAPL|nr:chromatin assembly factor 1 subunit B-like [Acanthaster planci]XP_022107614.1 chromatin assembly factor 1 subunit B-like [Acanthaster planci]XP_022107615.1 chromatin assembly factor 1 subunit B-like [Acanthaster planci]XP_022107616.1 chromatin assembly factor 1 subunit B-like [Acanthaster planci]XP_022107617.1 chromatin assembly factor 1 subunit B-like [Acanthaster planci]